jgi:DNA-binding CsgD family transcriptional regulator
VNRVIAWTVLLVLCLACPDVGYARQSHPEPLVELTAEEKDTLRLLVRGNSPRQVASSLRLSEETVESTKRRIMKKLGAANEEQLLAIAQAEADIVDKSHE